MSSGLVLVLCLVCGSLLVPLPAGQANPLPECALLLHVQPHTDFWRDSPITDCWEIQRTTTSEGRLQFLLFFDPLALEYEHYPFGGLTTRITWPDGWQLEGYADYWGIGDFTEVGSHSLDVSLEWVPEWYGACPVIEGSILLIACFDFEVLGPGRLELEYPSEIHLGCPPDGYHHGPALVGAEAGTTCEFTSYQCASFEYCAALFDEDQMELTAPSGGTAEGSVLYSSLSEDFTLCPNEVTVAADWASAYVVDEEPGDAFGHLYVSADAHGLAPGVYETEVRLAAPEVARCLPVILTVTESSSVPEEQIPAAATLPSTWGRIKATYR
ncbi:MAG: hypothetical protein ACE15D_16980 [Candidatus Eisenbacteria bacterium]|nr:hypothetical protein [Candidatus Eisenbacteria bacterium]